MYHTTLRIGWERFLAQVAKKKKRRRRTCSLSPKLDVLIKKSVHHNLEREDRHGIKLDLTHQFYRPLDQNIFRCYRSGYLLALSLCKLSIHTPIQAIPVQLKIMDNRRYDISKHVQDQLSCGPYPAQGATPSWNKSGIKLEYIRIWPIPTADDACYSIFLEQIFHFRRS